LKVLREAGLVSQRAEGTRRLYSARPDGLRMIANWTRSRRAFWEGSLDRLEAAFLEENA
jgi:DNA-binding transcriptional ArsR family regulator